MEWGNNHEIKKKEVEIVNIINRYILLFKKRERMEKKEKCFLHFPSSCAFIYFAILLDSISCVIPHHTPTVLPLSTQPSLGMTPPNFPHPPRGSTATCAEQPTSRPFSFRTPPPRNPLPASLPPQLSSDASGPTGPVRLTRPDGSGTFWRADVTHVLGMETTRRGTGRITLFLSFSFCVDVLPIKKTFVPLTPKHPVRYSPLNFRRHFYKTSFMALLSCLFPQLQNRFQISSSSFFWYFFGFYFLYLFTFTQPLSPPHFLFRKKKWFICDFSSFYFLSRFIFHFFRMHEADSFRFYSLC